MVITNRRDKMRKILGLPIALFLVGLIVIGGATAALLTYYVNITANTSVGQSVVFSDDSTSKTYSFDGEIYAGDTFSDYFTIKNRANVPATAELQTSCIADSTDCDGINWSYTKPIAYTYNENINIVNDYDLNVIVEDIGDGWFQWTFDFPVDDWEGNGQIPVSLIIATNGVGEGPAFQIHNNDGTDSTYDWGTWLYSPWGPTIEDGWNGWHSGSDNTLVDDISLIEASGEYYAQGEDGVLEIRIHRNILGDEFHWAAYPQTGGGWYSPYKNQQMPTPVDFSWGEPIVGSDNYHLAVIAEEIIDPFTLDSGEEFSFFANFDFAVNLQPDTFNIETRVVPVTS